MILMTSVASRVNRDYPRFKIAYVYIKVAVKGKSFIRSKLNVL